MLYYIFRHGETYYSKNHLQYRNKSDAAEILPEGIPKIKKIAKTLEKNGIEIIFSSPVKRCVQTVSIIQKEAPHIKIIIKDNLKEQEITTNNEKIENLVERIKLFLDETNNIKLAKVGICSHGWPIAVIIALLKNKPINKLTLLNYPRCGEIVIIDTK